MDVKSIFRGLQKQTAFTNYDMKRDLLLYALSLLLFISITGCSVVRFAETRSGYGIKPANKTDLDLDFQLGFNAASGSLNVTLAYQPYSIYKPRITLTDLGVGVVALGIFGKVYYDHWNHKNTFTVLDDTFDWYGTDPWEKAVLIGVPVDILLYWCFSYPFDRKMVKLPKQPIMNHQYRVDLPDHGSLGIFYRTTTGREQIAIDNFLSELRNPSYLQNIESLKFRVSTEVGGKWYKRDYTVTGFIPPELPEPSPKAVAVEVAWLQSRLKAGEQATLKVIAKNTGTAILTGFTVKTVSRDPSLNGWELAFGNIAEGASETRVLRCVTDKHTRPQEKLSVRLHFETVTGVVHPEIETHLEIIE